MTSDATNNLQSSYNLINLPAQIKSGNNVKANYTYLSDGTKAAAYTSANAGRDYAGSFTYTRGSGGAKTLESVAFGGGRIRRTGTNTYDVDYYITDHLGSVRAIVNAGGSVVEQNDYYPFGTRHPNGLPTLSANRWRFSGKEEQDAAFGIAYSDFGTRLYDRSASWTAIDPMAEKYYSISPYVYCIGNPARFVDPEGLSTWVYANENGTYTVFGGDLYDNDLNSYLYEKDSDGNFSPTGISIGTTPDISSFYNYDEDAIVPPGWQIGVSINPLDYSGISFLQKMNCVGLLEYMLQAYSGGVWDFKVTNGEENTYRKDIYRGMPIGSGPNGAIYASARDVGNIAAGLVSGNHGITWKSLRAALDLYQIIDASFRNNHFSPERERSSSTRAQRYGWEIGSRHFQAYKKGER